MLNSFKKITSTEANNVSGGCQCFCNTVPSSTSEENIKSLGYAKSLMECSKVCRDNEWLVVRCEKDDQDK